MEKLSGKLFGSKNSGAEEFDSNISSFTIPSIIVDNFGKIVSFNDSASIFFSSNISYGDNLKELVSEEVWGKISCNSEEIGSIEDLSRNILYFFKNYGNHYIIIVENISDKIEFKNKFYSETRYIAYLSHHINNPLTVVKNTYELVRYGLNILRPILEEQAEKIDKKQDSTHSISEIITLLYENIHDQGESLKQLEQNMRYLRNIGSMPYGGKIKSYKSLSISNLLDLIHDNLGFMLSQIDFLRTLPENLKETQTILDIDDFITLFYIIFENSVYAIRRTSGIDKGALSLIVSEEKESLVFLIENNGRKMSDRELDHCFDPFFSTKDNAEGLGLGLTNAALIVKSYGGKITISNKENSSLGVIYKLTFPKYRVLK